MSELTPWSSDDEPVAVPARPLPRLQIIHLLLWTTATAVAFLPSVLQSAAMARIEDDDAVTTIAESPVLSAVSVVHTVCFGVALFVATAAVVWSFRGYQFRFAPGHYISFEAAARWLAANTALALWLCTQDEWTPYNSYQAYWIPQAVVSIVFLFWYLMLAIRSVEHGAWRLAFVVMAVAPIVPFLEHAVWRSGQGLGELVDAGAQTLVVVIAIGVDRRRRILRHWSHWAVAISAIVVGIVLAAYYAWWIYYAEW